MGLEQHVLDCIIAIKHLPGQHDQRTHGNRFGHVSGLGKVQVRVGGGAPGRNVEKWDDSGNPLLVTMKPGKKPKKVVPSHEVVQGKELSEEDILAVLKQHGLDDDPTGKKFVILTNENGDGLLKAMYQKQGFDGKPHVVDDKELDDFIKNGDREGFRGIEDAKEKGYHLDYEHGDYHAGHGTYGNGTYVALVKEGKVEKAKEVATRYAETYSHKQIGIVTRMAVSKDAKMGKYEQLKQEAYSLVVKLSGKNLSLKIKKHNAKTPSEKEAMQKEINENEAMMRFYKDPGRYAAAKGYDGYYVDKDHQDYEVTQYTVMLNRTATRVSTNYMEVK